MGIFLGLALEIKSMQKKTDIGFNLEPIVS